MKGLFCIIFALLSSACIAAAAHGNGQLSFSNEEIRRLESQVYSAQFPVKGTPWKESSKVSGHGLTAVVISQGTARNVRVARALAKDGFKVRNVYIIVLFVISLLFSIDLFCVFWACKPRSHTIIG